MWYSEQHQQVIRTPRPIEVSGVNHPQSIFRLWDNSSLAAIGITPARIENSDQRFYTTGNETITLVDGETVIGYESVKRDIDGLRKQLATEIKQMVGSILSPSDWRIVREQEGYKTAGTDWKTWRAAVRDHGNSLDTEVATLDFDGVVSFRNHAVQEVRYLSGTDAEGNETIGPETETVSRTVDRINWGWPSAPDAPIDPYHVSYVGS